MRHQKGSLLLQTVSWPSPRLEDTPAHTEHWCPRHASANHPTLTNQRHPSVLLLLFIPGKSLLVFSWLGLLFLILLSLSALST